MAAKNRPEITQFLDSLFQTVEARFKAEQIARFRAQAQGQLNAFLNYLELERPALRTDPISRKQELSIPSAYGNGHYVKAHLTEADKREYSHLYSMTYRNEAKQLEVWALVQRIAGEGKFWADEDQAEKEAIRYVEDAKAHFIHKQGGKLESALGARKISRITGSLRLQSGVVVGQIAVEVEGGDRFGLEVKVITNYRYEPKFLAFHQFPARFVSARIGGVDVKPKSEAWMAEHFAGQGPKPEPRYYPAPAVAGRGKFIIRDRANADKQVIGSYPTSKAAASRKANELNRALEAASA